MEHLIKMEKIAIEDFKAVIDFYQTDFDEHRLTLHRDMFFDTARRDEFEFKCKCLNDEVHYFKENETDRGEAVSEILSAILDLEVIEKVSDMNEEDRRRLEYTRDIFNKCDCLQSCTSLHYTAETSQTEIHIVKTYLASGIMDQDLSQETKELLEAGVLTTSQVDIFFKESQFLALHRSELYGQTDFLANCGGLLGLFMGFSLLSLLEIIYFLTIRLWFKYKTRQQCAE